jgi:hypothetical protein
VLLATGQAAIAESEKYSDAEQKAIIECITRQAQLQMSKKNRHLSESVVSQACKTELSFWVEAAEPEPSSPLVGVSSAPGERNLRETFITKHLLEASIMYDKAMAQTAREPAKDEQARQPR